MTANSDCAAGLAPAEPRNQKLKAFSVSEHVRTIHGADGATVLDIFHGQMFTLNFAGSRILELLKHGSAGARDRGTTRARVQDRASATAEADVREFLKTLERNHLLTVRDGNSLA